MNNYKVQKGQQGEDVLVINGIQSICPFTPPLMIGGNLGQTQILRLPCSTVCPFAHIESDDDDITEYHITCHGIDEALLLTNDESNKNNDNVKKMIIL
jgi:hypothetical protein